MVVVVLVLILVVVEEEEEGCRGLETLGGRENGRDGFGESMSTGGVS